MYLGGGGFAKNTPPSCTLRVPLWGVGLNSELCVEKEGGSEGQSGQFSISNLIERLRPFSHELVNNPEKFLNPQRDSKPETLRYWACALFTTERLMVSKTMH